MKISLFALLFSLTAFQSPAFAGKMAAPTPNLQEDDSAPTFMDELDPFDPRTPEFLQKLDQVYEQETGISAHLPAPLEGGLTTLVDLGCQRASCAIWARVDKATQTLTLYINGQATAQWDVSTGVKGRTTPDFDRHPDGRIYDKYSSRKFPGGDYNGLGNMPYVVFIQGGFAIHGTPKGNWSKLGHRASHGCIRVHPDNAKYFNRLVRQAGVQNVWITVE